MVGGTVPGNHDGMGAFAGGGGNVVLIRNHERNGSARRLHARGAVV